MESNKAGSGGPFRLPSPLSLVLKSYDHTNLPYNSLSFFSSSILPIREQKEMFLFYSQCSSSISLPMLSSLPSLSYTHYIKNNPPRVPSSEFPKKEKEELLRALLCSSLRQTRDAHEQVSKNVGW